MPYSHRIPEGQEIDETALNVFARVSRWSGFAAARRIKKILGRHLVPGMRMLDIGTGPATIPLYLNRFFPDVRFTGLDISLGMLRKAVENKTILNEKIDLLTGNGECLPFRSKSIDMITSFFALHHIDRPEYLLKEIERVLKPNGVVLCIDFRRDVYKMVYYTLNLFWQTAFFFTKGRFGFQSSVQSAWRSAEIETTLKQHNISGFQTHTNLMELWIHKGLI